MRKKNFLSAGAMNRKYCTPSGAATFASCQQYDST